MEHPGTLHLQRTCLDGACPSAIHEKPVGEEWLLYLLVGRVRVYTHGRCLGTFGGRRSVTEPQAHAVRFPAGMRGAIQVVLDDWAADYLVARCPHPSVLTIPCPYLHWNDTVFHEVGSGTHRRRVGEVPTPDGYALSCGETLNPPGSISSWPAHATAEDRTRYLAHETTWEERFFIVAPSPGIAVLDGVFPDRRIVTDIVPLPNGAVVPMPLGSHAVSAAPHAWLWYFWVYLGTALQKQYNKYSTDCAIYVK